MESTANRLALEKNIAKMLLILFKNIGSASGRLFLGIRIRPVQKVPKKDPQTVPMGAPEHPDRTTRFIRFPSCLFAYYDEI